MTALAIHLAGDCAPGCGPCDAEVSAHLPEVDPCEVCGDGFTAAEWDDRHTGVDGGDVHAGCCGQCVPFVRHQDRRRLAS